MTELAVTVGVLASIAGLILPLSLVVTLSIGALVDSLRGGCVDEG